MTNFFPEDVREAAAKMGGDWIDANEFEGEGLTLKCVSVTKIVGNNPKYAADEKNYLYKKGVLAIGEQFHYIFQNAEGVEQKFDSASAPLFIAFQTAEIEAGDWVAITREGKATNTRYIVLKTVQPAPVAKNKVEYPTEGNNPDKVPF